MSDFSVIVWAVVGLVVSAAVLYVVIRLAIVHALRSLTKEPDEALEILRRDGSLPPDWNKKRPDVD